MKTITTFSFILMLFSTSCEDEKRGTCMACCDANRNTANCEMDFTEEKCADYNKRKVDGYDWTFSEGNLPCFSIPNP